MIQHLKAKLAELNSINSLIAKRESNNFRENLKKFLKNTNVGLGLDSIALQDKDIRNYFFKGDSDFKVFYRILAKMEI